MRLEVVRTVAALRAAVQRRRPSGARLGVVPTMGALHAGHLALVARSRDLAEVTVATLFVNPTQFAANEDLSKYPRTEDEDIAKLESVGTDILYAPDVSQVYPPGFATTVNLAGPANAGLEDRFRPGHFAGVATVVAKLFLQTGADIAVFGEKDWQQLCVVRRMATDLDIPIRIEGLATVREPDGLAMSSRNRYLSPEARARAPVLHRVMTGIAAAARRGDDLPRLLARGRDEIAAEGFALDYLEAREAASLAPLEKLEEPPARLLVAARLAGTRLIDNIAL